jgi:hypothetical protein
MLIKKYIKYCLFYLTFKSECYAVFFGKQEKLLLLDVQFLSQNDSIARSQGTRMTRFSKFKTKKIEHRVLQNI